MKRLMVQGCLDEGRVRVFTMGHIFPLAFPLIDNTFSRPPLPNTLSWGSGRLEVVFEAIDPLSHEFSLEAPDALRVGGVLQRPPRAGQPLQLRLLLDATLLEVFTWEGEVLSTRVYRGRPPTFLTPATAAGVMEGEGVAGRLTEVRLGQPGAAVGAASACGIDVVSMGGESLVTHLACFEMASIWLMDDT